MRYFIALAAVAGVGCASAPQNRLPAAGAPLDLPRIYAAALGDSGGAVSAGSPRASALWLDLMSDSGTYEASGRLPDSVARFLLARGLASEICVVSDSTDVVPRCIAQHAWGYLRVSRVIRVAPDTVRVFVGGANIQPVAEPSALLIPVGSTILVTLVWNEGRWRVVARRMTMMT